MNVYGNILFKIFRVHINDAREFTVLANAYGQKRLTAPPKPDNLYGENNPKGE